MTWTEEGGINLVFITFLLHGLLVRRVPGRALLHGSQQPDAQGAERVPRAGTKARRRDRRHGTGAGAGARRAHKLVGFRSAETCSFDWLNG